MIMCYTKKIPQTVRLALAVAGISALGLAASRPVAAQSLICTLTGVTFADGAVATGYFTFNPTTDMAGAYDITTTNGVTDSLTGAHYALSTVSPGITSPLAIGNFAFEFGTNNGFNSLTLNTVDGITSAGVYSLTPGYNLTANGYTASGEATPLTANGSSQPIGVAPRLVTTGSLVVTDAPAAVPEASTTVSFGLLLALGMGGAVIAAKKKKAPESA